MSQLTRDRQVIYDSVALTAAYPASGVVPNFEIDGLSELYLAITYTNGASGIKNELFWYVELSHDSTVWYRPTNVVVLSDTSKTFLEEVSFEQAAADGGVDRFMYEIPTTERHIRVRFRELLNSGVHGGIDVELGTLMRTQ